MKKIRSNVIILIIVSLLVLFFVLKDDFGEIITILSSSNIIYILIGIIVILLGDLFKSISITSLVKRNKKEYKLKEGFSLILKTNFFNGVTPFCLGGQPFQLYTLKKKNNIPYRDGISLLFQDFYSYQLSLVILSTIALFVNYIFNIVEFTNIVSNLVFLGYVINFAIVAFLMYLPFSKTNAIKIFKVIINILNKLRLIKDKEKSINVINDSIIHFKDEVKKINKEKKLIIKCIFANMLRFIMIGLVTYICFKSINSYVPIIDSIIISIIIFTMSSLIPVPGGTGGMELGFITLFSVYATSIEITATMLIWRFLTYYMLVILGFFIVFIKNKE